MATTWQITSLSTKDTDGRYIDACVEDEVAVEKVFDAEEDISAVSVKLFRLTRDSERTGKDSPIDELVDDAASAVIYGQYVWVSLAGYLRHEVYRIVLVFEGEQNGDWPRTRMLECVA